MAGSKQKTPDHKSLAPPPGPTHSAPPPTDRIRARAYEIYERRRDAGEPGDAISDWSRAEEELHKEESPVRLRVVVTPHTHLTERIS